MLKRIREEKTFRTNVKSDIQQALNNIEATEDDAHKAEQEEKWLEELVERKKQEVKLGSEPAKGRKEEQKRGYWATSVAQFPVRDDRKQEVCLDPLKIK